MKPYVFLFSLLALIGLQTPAFAALDGKIATLNIQAIMKDSTAAKSVREQLDAKRKGYEAEMSKKEEDLRKEDQELSKQRAVLTPDAFEKKLKDFREKASAAQRDVAAKRSQLDTSFTNAVNEIHSSASPTSWANSRRKKAIPSSSPPRSSSGPTPPSTSRRKC